MIVTSVKGIARCPVRTVMVEVDIIALIVPEGAKKGVFPALVEDLTSLWNVLYVKELVYGGLFLVTTVMERDDTSVLPAMDTV